MPTSISTYRRFRATLWRWRWVTILVFTTLIAHNVLSTITLTNQPRYPAVVASADLPAGHELSADDVETNLVHDLLPDMATDPADLVGFHLLTPVSSGAAIGKNQVLSPEVLAKPRPGFVIAPVLLADTGGLSMLQTGSYIDLFAPAPDSFGEGSGEAELIARHIRVAGVAQSTGESTFFRDMPDTMRFFLEIPDSTVKVILGAGTRTPLLAVLSHTPSE
ncbi:SAF domain-containing protein [Arcanobacterium pinnipediorum]|uniref:SAF domain-containing protein n=1 Tax=Arcanobacterium pinnipediorum TaxID=1503041 RepID=A0ABY5AGA4_9ACTO|nr:SAF domain-containing protein [Arcanobacterium pinnipediorum]USR79239.1 SAF domain-containing protein [Arcanobacterium pinnipediorum]